MRITYDRSVDAAYVELNQIEDGGVARTVSLEDGVNLDFDTEGRLLGVEVLAASRRLHPSTLSVSEDVTPEEHEASSLDPTG